MQLQCDGRTESAWPKSNLTAIDRALSNNEERNVEKSILDSHDGVYAIYIPRFFCACTDAGNVLGVILS